MKRLMRNKYISVGSFSLLLLFSCASEPEWLPNQRVISKVSFGFLSTEKRANAEIYEWDTNSTDVTIAIPDTLPNGYKVTNLGAYLPDESADHSDPLFCVSIRNYDASLTVDPWYGPDFWGRPSVIKKVVKAEFGIDDIQFSRVVFNLSIPASVMAIGGLGDDTLWIVASQSKKTAKVFIPVFFLHGR